MTSALALRKVSVSYGAFAAVTEATLSLEQGQIGVLLGPSGCGKTTLLRAIGGFEPIVTGEIALDDKVISSAGFILPPERRRVGMVFQDFALFPHLNIERNVAFGLQAMSASDRQARVQELLELVDLREAVHAFPHELSGGQQQRVALVRALAPRPNILLLDEPFSSLDSELREQLAIQVRQILKRDKVTAIMVTHDQQEAFSMADQVALMAGGRILQADTPFDLYHNPSTEFVAEFVGRGDIISLNQNEVVALGLDQVLALRQPTNGRPVKLLLRPDDVRYDSQSALSLPVVGRIFRGAQYLYTLQLPSGQCISCLSSSHVDVGVGASMPVRFDLRHVVTFGEDE